MSQNNKKGLDNKSIRKIAAQVEQNLRQNGAAPAADGAKGSCKAGTGKSRFFWGAVSGVALAAAAPLFSKQLRPVVRGAIKGGIASGRYVRKVAEGMKEDLQDLSAEAKADLDANLGNDTAKA
jgi:hypothetical protein